MDITDLQHLQRTEPFSSTIAQRATFQHQPEQTGAQVFHLTRLAAQVHRSSLDIKLERRQFGEDNGSETETFVQITESLISQRVDVDRESLHIWGLLADNVVGHGVFELAAVLNELHISPKNGVERLVPFATYKLGGQECGQIQVSANSDQELRYLQRRRASLILKSHSKTWRTLRVSGWWSRGFHDGDVMDQYVTDQGKMRDEECRDTKKIYVQ